MDDNEPLFSKKVTAALDESLERIDPSVLAKLAQGRARAMQAHGKALNTVAVSQRGSTLALASAPGLWGQSSNRVATAVILLALAISGWNAHSHWVNASAEETAELDAYILSDDAPLQAYSDPIFSMTVAKGLLKNRSED